MKPITRVNAAGVTSYTITAHPINVCSYPVIVKTMDIPPPYVESKYKAIKSEKSTEYSVHCGVTLGYVKEHGEWGWASLTPEEKSIIGTLILESEEYDVNVWYWCTQRDVIGKNQMADLFSRVISSRSS